MSSPQLAKEVPSDLSRQARGPWSSPKTVATLCVLLLLDLPMGGWLFSGDSLNRQIEREAVFWALTVFLLGYILFFERRPLSSIGLRRPTLKGIATGLLVAILLLAGAALIVTVVFPWLGLGMNERAMGALSSAPGWFLLLVLARAAIFEEIYYRGFAIERIAEITRTRWLAAAISLTAFTLAHLAYWGWTHLILVAFAGGGLTGLYLLRRDLSANIVAHFVFDILGFLLG